MNKIQISSLRRKLNPFFIVKRTGEIQVRPVKLVHAYDANKKQVYCATLNKNYHIKAFESMSGVIELCIYKYYPDEINNTNPEHIIIYDKVCKDLSYVHIEYNKFLYSYLKQENVEVSLVKQVPRSIVIDIVNMYGKF